MSGADGYDIWSIDFSDPSLYYSGLAIFVAGIFASASGIGGGGIFVAVLMLISDMTPYQAVPLSKSLIFSGSVMSFYVNYQKRDARGNRLIQSDLVYNVVPMALGGTLLGVLLNSIVPRAVLVLLLSALLIFMTFKLFKQGYTNFREEDAKMSQRNVGGHELTSDFSEQEMQTTPSKMKNQDAFTATSDEMECLSPRQPEVAEPLAPNRASVDSGINFSVGRETKSSNSTLYEVATLIMVLIVVITCGSLKHVLPADTILPNLILCFGLVVSLGTAIMFYVRLSRSDRREAMMLQVPMLTEEHGQHVPRSGSLRAPRSATPRRSYTFLEEPSSSSGLNAAQSDPAQKDLQVQPRLRSATTLSCSSGSILDEEGACFLDEGLSEAGWPSSPPATTGGGTGATGDTRSHGKAVAPAQGSGSSGLGLEPDLACVQPQPIGAPQTEDLSATLMRLPVGTSPVTYKYPLVAFFTGICSGLMGIGGGLIFAPFFLMSGLDPTKAVVTSATCVIFTATSTTFQYLFLGRIMIPQMFLYGSVSFLSSICGTKLIHYVKEKTGRSSPVVFIVAVTVGISCGLLVAKGIQYAQQDWFPQGLPLADVGGPAATAAAQAPPVDTHVLIRRTLESTTEHSA